MHRHNLPLTRHAATDISATGYAILTAYNSNCLISPGWLASIAEGNNMINTLFIIRNINNMSHERTQAPDEGA